MRKADYERLARELREAIEHYGNATATGEAIRLLAERLADRLSVDRAAFLRACGIE